MDIYQFKSVWILIWNLVKNQREEEKKFRFTDLINEFVAVFLTAVSLVKINF